MSTTSIMDNKEFAGQFASQLADSVAAKLAESNALILKNQAIIIKNQDEIKAFMTEYKSDVQQNISMTGVVQSMVQSLSGAPESKRSVVKKHQPAEAPVTSSSLSENQPAVVAPAQVGKITEMTIDVKKNNMLFFKDCMAYDIAGARALYYTLDNYTRITSEDNQVRKLCKPGHSYQDSKDEAFWFAFAIVLWSKFDEATKNNWREIKNDLQKKQQANSISSSGN